MKPHYLVIQRHEMDNVPILLTDDAKLAKHLAKVIAPDDYVAIATAKRLGINPTTPVCTAVVTFNKDGIPTKMEIVRDYEQEDGE